MFGLTFEKILLIAIIAAFLLGPTRLPQAAEKLARLVRTLKALAGDAQARIRDEVGPEFDDVDWKKLDPRQFDPRRIVTEALRDPDPVSGEDSRRPAQVGVPGRGRISTPVAPTAPSTSVTPSGSRDA
jgi:sec-independent protein translocase protein TatB